MKQILRQISISDRMPKHTQWIIVIGLAVATVVAEWKGSDFWTYFLGALAFLALIYAIATK